MSPDPNEPLLEPTASVSADPVADAEPSAEPSLEDEIKMLRRINKHIAKLIEENMHANKQGDRTSRIISLFSTLGHTTTRVAGLLKSQQLLTGKQGEVSRLLQQALADILKENEQED
jgi:hypothetical protein